LVYIQLTIQSTALQSVFPQAELGTFMNLTKRDKERQLNELTLIVTGIRLFNKDCGKGGEGIDDLLHGMKRCFEKNCGRLDLFNRDQRKWILVRLFAHYFSISIELLLQLLCRCDMAVSPCIARHKAL